MAKTSTTVKSRLLAPWRVIGNFFKSQSQTDSAKALVLKEFLGLVMFSIAIMLTLALISFNPLDNQNIPTHNWLGPIGAKLSELFLGCFGILSLSFPLM